MLRGRFLGQIDADGTDVENLVLTNIEIPERQLDRGFAFEHDPRPPQAAACGYEYQAVDSAEPFDLWRPATRALLLATVRVGARLDCARDLVGGSHAPRQRPARRQRSARAPDGAN